MAVAATPLAPMQPQSVEADLFSVGTAKFEPAQEKNDGEMLPEQVPQPFERESGVQVRFLIAAPGGPSFSMPSARPERVMFGALNDPEYRLLREIPLDVTVEESTVVVNWANIDEFGTGETLSAAISDFARSLRELFRHLCTTSDLGPDLLRVKEILAKHIEARPR